MKINKSFHFAVVLSAFACAAEQPARAFSIVSLPVAPLPCSPLSALYCPVHSFSIPSSDGGTVSTKLKPMSILPLGGTQKFLKLLNTSIWEQNGWSFQQASPSEALQGYFGMLTYNAYATLPSVGSTMQIQYIPVGTDPVGDNIHWIQRVVSNHATARTLTQLIESAHGTSEDKIDLIEEQRDPNFIDPTNPQKSVFNPYYDTYSPLANQVSFADRTGRQDIFENHNWYAELYLVEEIAPKTVKIYNGISWGWDSLFVPNHTKKVSDSLSAGETDSFIFNDLTPGADFLAWIDNDLPQNRCNPNTILSGSGNYDDDSSFLGDGLASAFTGKVSSNGKINLNVYGRGGRGEDRGDYDLYVKVYNPDESPDLELLGGSGGGGILPRPKGRTQNDPILANQKNGDWQIFRNVPSCRWYDPHTPYGFEFQALDDTLFTEIVDFPVSADDLYSVAVDGTILGQFGAGQSLDFVKLFGKGISNFTITGINSLIGATPETAFPIQLAFNSNRGSFQMRPFDKPKPVPEPTATWGLLTLAFLGFSGIKPKR